jgi:hypothetical protein
MYTYPQIIRFSTEKGKKTKNRNKFNFILK